MKVKVSELASAALDWTVGMVEGYKDRLYVAEFVRPSGEATLMVRVMRDYENGKWMRDSIHYSPSTDWAQGGPIIEREKLTVKCAVPDGTKWVSYAGWVSDRDYGEYGPTALIAAMRCFVASKLGDEVDVPEELK